MGALSNPDYDIGMMGETSHMGGDEPPGLIGSIGTMYDYARAGSEWAYQRDIEAASNDNEKKLNAAGYKLKPVFSLLESGRNIHAAGTEFQSLIAHNAPMPGPDERYEAVTDFQKRVSEAVTYNKEVIARAKRERPDLNIQDYKEMNDQVYAGIAKARTLDPRTGWLSSLAGGLIGGTAAIFSGANPYAPLEAIGLAFGGVGTSTASRIVTAGVAGATLNVVPQLGGRETLAQAGVPLSNDDLIMAGGLGMIFGAGGQALGELALGARGRARANDAYGFLTLSKRAEKYGPIADRREFVPTPEQPPPPPAPPPPATPVPSGVPGVIEAHVPRLAREANIILDQAPTPAAKVRMAMDLDHAAPQLEVIGAAPQDIIPPTRALRDSATAMPTIRTNQGPRLDMDAPELPPAWKRAARAPEDSGAVTETLARQGDPETFAKWDKVNTELKAAERQLAEVVKFHAAAKLGKADMLDQHLLALADKAERARSPVGKAAVHAEIDELVKYHQGLIETRPGGTPPAPIKGYDRITLGQRVVGLTEKRDQVFGDVERAMARADNRWGLPSAQRDALEDQLRPGATDRINRQWAWPKGVKRSKNRAKSPYEVNILKGPTTEELFAERKLELPQQTDPLASEGRQPGETPAQTATRVNDLTRKAIDETEADKFVTTLKDFIKTLEDKTTSMRVPKVKPGEEPVIPTMPAGMALSDLAKVKGFEVDGVPMTFREAIDDLLGDAEAHAAVSSCSLTE